MKQFRILALLMFSVLLFSSCNLPSNDQLTDQPGQVQTMAALTVEARITQNASSDNSGDLAATNAVSIPATNTPLPSNTPIPTNPESGTATSVNTDPCNRGGFVDDITIPDGTEMDPGETFTKTWRLRNTGSCTWTSDYKLAFDSGDPLGAPAMVNLPGINVSPDQIVDVSVNFTAPTTPGNYKSNWKLRSNTGEIFGIGTNANISFFVEINVIAPLSYALSAHNSHDCTGDLVVAFAVENEGTEFIQSATGTVTNLDTSVTKSLVIMNDPFVEDPNSCSSGYVSDADPGETYYFLVNLGPATSGDRFQVTTSMCTENGLGGECLDQTINYKVP
jgi:hypothetical protein